MVSRISTSSFCWPCPHNTWGKGVSRRLALLARMFFFHTCAKLEGQVSGVIGGDIGLEPDQQASCPRSALWGLCKVFLSLSVPVCKMGAPEAPTRNPRRAVTQNCHSCHGCHSYQ